MNRKHRSKLMATGKSLKNTRGKELHGQFHELETAIRSIGRWLQDESVSSVKSRCHLSPREEDRVVPGHQSTRNANGHMSNSDGLLLGVLDEFFFELQGRCDSDHLQRAVKLILSNAVGLALFSDEKLDKILAISLESIGVGMEALTAVLVSGLGPGLESFLGGRYGIVEVLLGGDWGFWIGLCGGRVETVTGLL